MLTRQPAEIGMAVEAVDTPALLLDLCFVDALDTHLEISRSQTQGCLLARTLCFEQHIGENGHRVSFLDDCLNTGETTLEFGLVDGKLHGGISLVALSSLKKIFKVVVEEKIV